LRIDLPHVERSREPLLSAGGTFANLPKAGAFAPPLRKETRGTVTRGECCP